MTTEDITISNTMRPNFGNVQIVDDFVDEVLGPYTLPMMLNGKPSGLAHIRKDGELDNAPSGTITWALVVTGDEPLVVLVWTKPSSETRMNEYG